MRFASTSAIVFALGLGTSVSAQFFAMGSFGRYPCGTTTPDPSQCTAANMATNTVCAPFGSLTVDEGGGKSNGPLPVNPTCTLDVRGGLYFCGIAGSFCADSSNCDNGECVAGLCSGGYTTRCTLDSQCTGNLYCLNGNNPPTPNTAGVCGGSGADGTSDGALCDDGCSAGNFLCGSGTCDPNSATCVGVPLSGPSQRARARRSTVPAACPVNHEMCLLPGGATGAHAIRGRQAAYECVDTSSNLEQCGGCASTTGVDCTAIPGVEAVGCVLGECEIWACSEDHVWDAMTASCTLA